MGGLNFPWNFIGWAGRWAVLDIVGFKFSIFLVFKFVFFCRFFTSGNFLGSFLQFGVILLFMSLILAFVVAFVGFVDGAASELVFFSSNNFIISWQLPLGVFNLDVLVGGRGVWVEAWGVILAKF